MTKLLILQMVSSKLIQWNSNKNGIKYNKTLNSVQNRIECVINNKDATSITDNAGL